MTEDSGPRLDWSDGDASKVTGGEEDEEAVSQDESPDSNSEEGLCKVEDPTCEACQ